MGCLIRWLVCCLPVYEPRHLLTSASVSQAIYVKGRCSALAVCRSLGISFFCVALRALASEPSSPPGRVGLFVVYLISFVFASSFCAEAFSFGEYGYFVKRVIVLSFLTYCGYRSPLTAHTIVRHIFLHTAVTAVHFRTETLRLLQSTAVTTANFLTYCSCMLKMWSIYNYSCSRVRHVPRRFVVQTLAWLA